MAEPRLIEHDDGVNPVTRNQPDMFKALDGSLTDASNVYFEVVQRNRRTPVVVLKGAGADVCARLDLEHAKTASSIDAAMTASPVCIRH